MQQNTRINTGVTQGIAQNIAQGIAIGAATVVPGLSGGTIALLCGIFERLIRALKSIDFKAVGLLLRGRFACFAQHIDLLFLVSLFVGLVLGNVLLAKLLGFLFEGYPIHTWAFFFGLVLVSVYFVGRNIKRFSAPICFSFLLGVLIAVGVTALPPAVGSGAFWYLMLCGVLAICSMLLPGLSGSYVLVLLGNYRLMLEGVGNLDMGILTPFLLGAVLGLLAFGQLLGWLFKNWHDLTITLLCGFIAGSLRSLWPWKKEILQSFGTKEKVVAYQYLLPNGGEELLVPGLLALCGAGLLIGLEAWAAQAVKTSD